MESRVDGRPLEITDRVRGQRVVLLEHALERLEDVDDVGPGAFAQRGLLGGQIEVHGRSVAGVVRARALSRAARDARPDQVVRVTLAMLRGRSGSSPRTSAACIA